MDLYMSSRVTSDESPFVEESDRSPMTSWFGGGGQRILNPGHVITSGRQSNIRHFSDPS